MSNLDYTLGVVSNIISETFSGIGEEYVFVNNATLSATYFDKTAADSAKYSIVANDGPQISIYQSLNNMYITS